MIIFGTKGRALDGSLVENLRCQNCGKNEHRSFGVGKYFHLFWVPILYLSKKVGLECTACSQQLFDKELGADLRKRLKHDLFHKEFVWRRRIFLFMSVVLGCFILLGYFTSEKEQAAYFQNPLVGDLYFVNADMFTGQKSGDYPYRIMRVESVSPDQMEFKVSKFAYFSAYDAEKDARKGKIKEESYFGDQSFTLDRSRLTKLKDSDFIDEIGRPGEYPYN